MAAAVTAQRKAWMLDTILDKIVERGGSMQVQIKLLLSKYDDDKSGELDMGEFRNALGDFLHGMDDAEFAALAETFDADGSGAVSIHEFEEALTKLAKDREEHGRQTSGGALTGVKTTHPPRPGTAGGRPAAAAGGGQDPVGGRGQAAGGCDAGGRQQRGFARGLARGERDGRDQARRSTGLQFHRQVTWLNSFIFSAAGTPGLAPPRPRSRR